MKTLSVGKFHGLKRCSTESDVMVLLAIDHRNSLRRILSPAHPEMVKDEQLTGFKLQVVKNLGDAVSALILDPQYGAAQLISSGTMPGGAGLIVALESSGFTGAPEERYSQVLPGWSAVKAKRLGVDAVRLLVYYHPEADSAPAIESLVDSVAQECQVLDVALFLEVLTYPVNDQAGTKTIARKHEVVLETTRILTTIPGVDVIITEFPVDTTISTDKKEWDSACYELSRASKVPWLLMSGVPDFKQYLNLVEIACRQGASGTAAGWVIWQDAVVADDAQRETILKKICRPRLLQLGGVCDQAAIPWLEFYRMPAVPSNWYESYNGMVNHE